MFCFRGFKAPTFVDTVGFSPFIFIIKQQQTKTLSTFFPSRESFHFTSSKMLNTLPLCSTVKPLDHWITESWTVCSVMRLDLFYFICYLLDLCEFIGPKILNPCTPSAHSVPECSWRQSENRITSLEDADEASLAASLVMTPVHAGSRAHLAVPGSDLSNQRSWQSVTPQPLHSAGAEWGRRERSE